MREVRGSNPGRRKIFSREAFQSIFGRNYRALTPELQSPDSVEDVGFLTQR